MKRNLLGISLITMGCLYGILAGVIILVFILFDLPVLYGIGISIIILILQFLISPFLTDLSMKWFYKADFNHEFPEYLNNFIKEVCDNNNMKLPRMAYIDDGAPNAFTYGHTKNDARIVLTRGIFDLLTEEEVKGVVGHELGHAVHYDMLLMTAAQIVPLVLYAIYEACMDTKGNSNDSGKGALVGLIAYVLYVISNYIILALSRSREYYADSFSAEVNKNPNALASALVKIGYGLSTADTNKKHSAAKSNALGIFDSKASKALVVSSYEDGEISKDNIKQAMKWEQWNIWAKWFEFNSTHPLISKRLLTLSEMSKNYNQEPYIVFDLEKPESYVDDFIVELIVNFAPTITFLIGLAFLVILATTSTIESALSLLPLVLFIVTLLSFLKFTRRRPNKNYSFKTVKDLLSEVKVSEITAIPCEVEGEIIGRGDPGCIFSEDMVIKDKTGIMFLDYNQPLYVINKIFALFKNGQMSGKQVKVKGWYRRSPVPYIEMKSYTVDDKEKKILTYGFKIFGYILAVVLEVAAFIFLYI